MHSIKAILVKTNDINIDKLHFITNEYVKLPQDILMIGYYEIFKIDDKSIYADSNDKYLRELRHFLTQAGLKEGSKFLVIETDYFGGAGSQAADCYIFTNENIILKQEFPYYPAINNSLQWFGVIRNSEDDEFDTIKLGEYREMSDIYTY